MLPIAIVLMAGVIGGGVKAYLLHPVPAQPLPKAMVLHPR